MKLSTALILLPLSAIALPAGDAGTTYEDCFDDRSWPELDDYVKAAKAACDGFISEHAPDSTGKMTAAAKDGPFVDVGAINILQMHPDKTTDRCIEFRMDVKNSNWPGLPIGHDECVDYFTGNPDKQKKGYVCNAGGLTLVRNWYHQEWQHGYAAVDISIAWNPHYN